MLREPFDLPIHVVDKVQLSVITKKHNPDTHTQKEILSKIMGLDLYATQSSNPDDDEPTHSRYIRSGSYESDLCEILTGTGLYNEWIPWQRVHIMLRTILHKYNSAVSFRMCTQHGFEQLSPERQAVWRKKTKYGCHNGIDIVRVVEDDILFANTIDFFKYCSANKCGIRASF